MAKKVGVGAGILAATAGAAAAGYYFYGSKDAKQHRQKAAKWAQDMKGDVVRQAKKLKKLDRAQVARVVDEIAKTYEDVRGLDKKDLARAVRELKNNWRHLETELRGSGRRAGATVKKAAKKTARKARKTRR